MERLAAAITESLIKKADYYIDLHGGDDYEELTPYVYFAGVAKPEIMEASRKNGRAGRCPIYGTVKCKHRRRLQLRGKYL